MIITERELIQVAISYRFGWPSLHVRGQQPVYFSKTPSFNDNAAGPADIQQWERLDSRLYKWFPEDWQALVVMAQ
jgi:hypothetical protein